jgi:integrase/recombinase XerD
MDHPNLTQRPNGIWYIVYHDNGRQRKKSTGTSKLGEAKRRRDYFFQKRAEGEWREVTRNPTFEQFEEKYKAWARQYHTRLTRETQWYRWRSFVEFLKARGRARLGDITRRDVRDFVTELLGSGKAKTTVNNHLRDYQAMFEHAIRDLETYNGENPVKAIKRMTVEESPPEYLTLEEVDRLLKAAKDHSRNLHWFCLLGVYQGLRLAEIGNLDWSMFDWDLKLLNLPSSEEKSLKSHKAAAVSLADKVIQAIKPFAKESGYLFNSGRPSQGKDRYRYNPKKAFKTIVKEAGLNLDTSPHWLRHTFCTQLAIAGVPLPRIQKEARHADIRTTMKYVHVQGYSADINSF